MTVENQIQNLISGANSILNIMNALIDGQQSIIIIPNDEATPIPTYSESTGVWTLMQQHL